MNPHRHKASPGLPALPYEQFLASKVKMAERIGFQIDDSEINPRLKPHQRASVIWGVAGGRRAYFLAFGLGKSVIQLETLRLVLKRTGGRGLIVAPLGVRFDIVRDARELLSWSESELPQFIQRIEEAGPTGIYITNYETIRDGKLDPAEFEVASLDEADILRGFGGTKTFRECMRLFTGDGGPTQRHRTDGKSVKYRYVATATPSPNEYIELLAYAEFLGVMDISAAKTRFFKRDSTKADHLTLHPHKEREFWLWMASWALFMQHPSDLGFPDDGYALPELQVNWHEVATDHRNAGTDRDGQHKMFRDASMGVTDAAAEKRNSLQLRLDKLMEIRAREPQAHRVIWHDLEAEREAIEAAIPGCVTVCGADTDEHKEKSIIGFSNGAFPEIAGKPCMLGSGVNWQRHCARAIYLGIGFKFKDFIQSLMRINRFLQTRTVVADIIYTEAERGVRKELERKWRQHNEMVLKMSGIIREYGLAEAAMAQTLTRKMGVNRLELKGERYHLVNNDCVLEAALMEENSVGLILTSIPFSTQYEYSPNFADFGHSEGNEEFFAQNDYLTPNLYRVLQPGRMMVIHVKDRVVPGGMTGLGFQVVYPFHAKCIEHYTKHGFGYMGMKTITTDVVRENNQTYRLSWTEQCTDATKMGVGMPEYLLYFRKPQTDTTRSYADVPVEKSKTNYSLARWQIDAHAYTRSNGDRLLASEEIANLPHAAIYKLYRDFSREQIYDFEQHVSLGESLARKEKLPTTFMLLPPQSTNPEVWTDITRMRTLNASQAQKGQQMHLCPMQLDIANRVITQLTMPGEVVWDPFCGIGTVPMCALKLGRIGKGAELSTSYFADGAAYCEAAEREMNTPTLFDLGKLPIGNGESTEPIVPIEESAVPEECINQ